MSDTIELTREQWDIMFDGLGAIGQATHKLHALADAYEVLGQSQIALKLQQIAYEISGHAAIAEAVLVDADNINFKEA